MWKVGASCAPWNATLAFVYGVALSGDGRREVSASYDHTLKVWDVESGRELRTLRGHAGAVHGVALSGDGRLAVSASDDNTLKVWGLGGLVAEAADAEEGDTLTEYAEVLAHAVDTFGSRTNANAWLNKPNRVFHNQSPLQILTEDPATVEEELVRIDHGMFI